MNKLVIVGLLIATMTTMAMTAFVVPTAFAAVFNGCSGNPHGFDNSGNPHDGLFNDNGNPHVSQPSGYNDSPGKCPGSN
jgi:hypothetical protein